MKASTKYISLIILTLGALALFSSTDSSNFIQKHTFATVEKTSNQNQIVEKARHLEDGEESLALLAEDGEDEVLLAEDGENEVLLAKAVPEVQPSISHKIQQQKVRVTKFFDMKSHRNQIPESHKEDGKDSLEENVQPLALDHFLQKHKIAQIQKVTKQHKTIKQATKPVQFVQHKDEDGEDSMSFIQHKDEDGEDQMSLIQTRPIFMIYQHLQDDDEEITSGPLKGEFETCLNKDLQECRGDFIKDISNAKGEIDEWKAQFKTEYDGLNAYFNSLSDDYTWEGIEAYFKKNLENVETFGNFWTCAESIVHTCLPADKQ